MSASRYWNPARIDALKHAFERALPLSANERTRFLDVACAGDDVLRDELASLLTAYDACTGYFETLSDQFVGAALAAFQNVLDESLEPGTTVSHYEILERVGGGGMGVVYRARDTRLGRTVALKFLLARGATMLVAHARLLAEAQVASALDHPNIGVVYEVGETDGARPFIAMAWYDGETLRDRLRRGHLSISEATMLATQLADALAAAHEAGIIHCDVKPANVVITQGGMVKLVDFGIARLMSADAMDERTAVGTLAYMSPEQTRGAPPDPRTDIWSLGVLLYEALTGRRPFSASSDELLIEMVRTTEPEPVTVVRPDVPAGLSSVLRRCMSKDPVDRFQSAAELTGALAACGVGTTTGVPANGLPWHRLGSDPRRRFTLVAAGLSVLGLTAYLGRELLQSTLEELRIVSTATTAQAAVVVLPFMDGATDPADEHLASGFSDELIAMLGPVRGMRVAPRGSAFALKAQGLSARAIGEQLGVAHVLEGNLTRSEDELQVSARLVRVSDGEVVWSASYDASVIDAFVVQHEIAAAVVRTLEPRGSRMDRIASARAPTSDLEAYELYLKGRFSWNQRTENKLVEALAYYRAALERDPQFALAYSGMAEAYVNMSNFGYMLHSEALARAEVASSRAIALDGSLAEAFASRGFVLASHGAFAESEESFQRALLLNPNYSWAHHYYALLLTMLGRLEEASALIQSSLVLDPLSLPANATSGILLSMRGQNDNARAQFQRALALSPDFPLTLHYLGVLEAGDGRYDEALEVLEKAYEHAPGFPGTRAALAYAYARVGRQADAQRLIDELRLAVTDERSRINLALGIAVLGDADAAFAMLGSAQWDVPTLIELRADPLLAEFRADPRYARLLETLTTKAPAYRESWHD